MTPQPVNGILHRLSITPSFTGKRLDIDAMFAAGKRPIDSGKRAISAEWSLVGSALPPLPPYGFEAFPVHPRLKFKLCLKPPVKFLLHV